MNIKIGYKGLVGSNSEEAAKAFKVNLGLPDADGCHNNSVSMAIENYIGELLRQASKH